MPVNGWDAETAVIGLGAWGSAALWQLARRGADVIGVDRFAPGHAWGASHGGSRMFRITCLEHPDLVPLARRSAQLWRALEHDSGEELFVRSGGLLIGPPDGPITGGTLRAAEAHGIEVEILSADELGERYPLHAAVPRGHIGVREPGAGIVRPEASVRAAVALARSAGARVLTGSRVTDLVAVPGGVEVVTATGTLRVRRAIVTVGAWLSTLLPRLPLETVRMPICWFRPATGTGGDGGDDSAGSRDSAGGKDFGLDRFPVFMREAGGGQVLWGNGRENGHDVKLGLEYGGGGFRPMDPEDTDRSVGAEDWTELARLLAVCVPGLDPVPARVAVGLFSRTPDGQFVIGSPDGDPRLIVAGGCNAHGGKHALGIGEALADLATGGETRMPLDFAHADRFPA
ncbi:FAD-dependent oxidoreductase [Streptomyces sp. NPDC047017]|uniref:FAD-dependent oxidoreductase n=1 Tax=Streptomyces sp. NPDC047017 TaxID=3155024 RepID=UPI0033DBDACD